MNKRERREYEEKVSPEMEYLQYLIEHPEIHPAGQRRKEEQMLEVLICYLGYLKGRERDCDTCPNVELCNRGVELIRKCECGNPKALLNLLEIIKSKEK